MNLTLLLSSSCKIYSITSSNTVALTRFWKIKMWDLEIALGLININGHATPSKILNWLSSIFAGILMCKIVYDLTGTISTLFFNGYSSKLSHNEKLDWKNRGFSTYHAILVAAGSLFLLLGSSLFGGDFDINMTSTLSDTIMGVSIGYFISDSAILLYHFPVLGGLEYVLHHGLSMYSIILSLVSGQAQIYILMVLFSEFTTPFVNLRWYLDVSGQKNSKLYIFNGVALFFGWLVARVLLFVFLFYHIFIHFDQVKKVFPLGFYSLLTVAPLLATMNAFWFWKIAIGLVKILNKAKHKAKHSQ